MSLHSPRPPARLWRRLATCVLAVALPAAYWMLVQAVGARFDTGSGEHLPPRPAVLLDRHTPRVD